MSTSKQDNIDRRFFDIAETSNNAMINKKHIFIEHYLILSLSIRSIGKCQAYLLLCRLIVDHVLQFRSPIITISIAKVMRESILCRHRYRKKRIRNESESENEIDRIMTNTQQESKRREKALLLCILVMYCSISSFFTESLFTLILLFFLPSIIQLQHVRSSTKINIHLRMNDADRKRETSSHWFIYRNVL